MSGGPDLYSGNLDGTGWHALTSDAAGGFEPRVSPDGRRVAWHSVRDGGHAIWVMNIDGGGARRLPTCGYSSDPSWSPDGHRIAYHSNCADGNSDIWMTNADGSGAPTRLTSDPAIEGMPAWSPDGRQVAYARSTGEVSSYDIDVLTLATGQVSRASTRAGKDNYPQWAPDSRSVVHDCDSQACVTDIAARTTQQIAASGGFDGRRPAWSHDGRLIIYAGPTSQGAGLWVVKADGADLRAWSHLRRSRWCSRHGCRSVGEDRSVSGRRGYAGGLPA